MVMNQNPMREKKDCIRDIIDEIDILGRAIVSYREDMRTYGTDEMITEIEAKAIDIIGNNSGIGVVKLSSILKRTKGATSMMVDRLCDKGLLERLKSDNDQRRTSLLLTEKGRIICEEHQLEIEQYYTDLAIKLSHYSLEEYEKCREIVSKLKENWV